MAIFLDDLSVLAGKDMRRKDAPKEQRRAEREARESEQRELRRARPKHDHAPRTRTSLGGEHS